MELLFAGVIFGVATLAYANGANDNFKGVATLFGSRTSNYKTALSWATIATLAGSICSIFLAKTLLKNFSGRGLVPDSIVTSPEFVFSLTMGAAATVLLATLLGLPISTTHSITGALVGCGFVASPAGVNLSKLMGTFFLPLILSPFLAMALAFLAYKTLHFIHLRIGIASTSSIFIQKRTQTVAEASDHPLVAFSTLSSLDSSKRSQLSGQGAYNGTLAGTGSRRILDSVHFLSAGIVSFARGLNDTPKIVGLLFGLQILEVRSTLLIVALCMAVGGLVGAGKVAHTMSKKICRFNDGQGVAALLVTGFLVIFSSLIGLPVSTTHVSVGSITGIGLVNKTNNNRMISAIATSWILTLPIAALISALVYFLLKA